MFRTTLKTICDTHVGLKWHPWNVSECQLWPCKICWSESQAINKRYHDVAHYRKNQTLDFFVPKCPKCPKMSQNILMLALVCVNMHKHAHVGSLSYEQFAGFKSVIFSSKEPLCAKSTLLTLGIRAWPLKLNWITQSELLAHQGFVGIHQTHQSFHPETIKNWEILRIDCSRKPGNFEALWGCPYTFKTNINVL